jgi:hypothetical protein
MQCQKCGASLQIQADGFHLLRSGRPPGLPPSASSFREDFDSGGLSGFKDFLAFRRMVVPVLIQILFWVGLAVCIVGGAALLGTRQPLMGLLLVFIGPVMVRVYCELLIVIFRMNETLTDIKNELRRKGT